MTAGGSLPNPPPPGGVVRRATAADVAAIVALVNRAYLVEAFCIDGDRTDAAEIAALVAREVIIVLEAGGALVGCVVTEIDAVTRRGYLGLLSVEPARQGEGAGRALVEAAEARARAGGCTAMDLKIVDLRADLPPFYRALGYAEDGTSPFPAEERSRQKRPCHFVHFTKALSRWP